MTPTDDGVGPQDPSHDIADGEGVAESTEFVWIFLPLPHPIGLPDKWQAKRGIDPRAMFRRGLSHPVDLSVLVHQVPRRSNVVADDLVDVALAAYRAVGQDTEVFEPPAELVDDLRTTITLVEVTLAWSAAEDVEEAVDLAIAAVRQMQLAVSTVTQSSVRLVDRATLPLFIPVFRGCVFLDGSHPHIEVFSPSAASANLGLVGPPLRRGGRAR